MLFNPRSQVLADANISHIVAKVRERVDAGLFRHDSDIILVGHTAFSIPTLTLFERLFAEAAY